MTADGCRFEGIPFPKGWCDGVAARVRGDAVAARAAFEAGRAEIQETLREQPDYAEALCVVGLLEAGLGNKEEAVRAGERAVELLPVTKDAINGPLLVQYLALIYVWTGETSLAVEQLRVASRIPGELHYGYLRHHPDWDSLRNNPDFEAIVTSLAPKENQVAREETTLQSTGAVD
jgi:tetratricopeptide (TPR) repeat protein